MRVAVIGGPELVQLLGARVDPQPLAIVPIHSLLFLLVLARKDLQARHRVEEL
jgi:hypothetical protein